MHVGEPVAMVVAETAAAAQDAAELVAVEYEELTPVIDARAALAAGAPQLWPEAPGNLAVDWPGLAADPDANARQGRRIFAAAKFVARIAVMNQRMVVASMEPRGATASYDAAADLYTLRVCSQSAGSHARQRRRDHELPKARLRVMTDDVGGAFGLKTGAYPEYLATWSAPKSSAGRCTGCRAVPRRSSATTRRATFIPRPSSRSTTRDASWRCASATPRQYRRLYRRGRRQHPDA